MLLIDKIEGNSGIGIPVYSRSGKMQNFQYIVMSPAKKPVEPVPEAVVNQDH